MDPSCPCIGKDQLPLDGDVGQVRHGCEGESLPAEGQAMVDLVISSDGLGVGKLSGGEHSVLLGIQSFIGKLNRVFLGHHCGKLHTFPAVHTSTAVCEHEVYLLMDQYALSTDG